MLINGFIKEATEQTFPSPRVRVFFFFGVVVFVVGFRVIDGRRWDDIWPVPSSLRRKKQFVKHLQSPAATSHAAFSKEENGSN